MQRLTADLLSLARNQENKAQEASATQQLDFIVDDAITLAKTLEDQNGDNLYDRKNVTIKKLNSVSSALPTGLEIMGDRDDLTRVVRNIVENALRYNKEKGLVEIRTEIAGDAVFLSIKDDGIGMTPEQIDHMFDRFWRADEARHHNSGGLGLGMSIALSMAQRNGVELKVTSELNKGTIVTIKFRKA